MAYTRHGAHEPLKLALGGQQTLPGILQAIVHAGVRPRVSGPKGARGRLVFKAGDRKSTRLNSSHT